MAAVVEGTTAEEEIRFRRPRNQSITDLAPDPQIPSIIQSTRRKSTISSLLLSTFTNNNNNTTMNNTRISNRGKISDVSLTLQHKKKNFTSGTFRGLGCASSSHVSAPEAIRSSADWQAKKVRQKKQRNPHKKKNEQELTNPKAPANPTSVAVVPDVWCSPGIAFVADADPVDCVVTRRPVTGRGRIDGERMNHREEVLLWAVDSFPYFVRKYKHNFLQRSYSTRRTPNLEHVSILESPSAFDSFHSGADIFEDRYYRHFHHRSPGGLGEIAMFQNSMLLGERSYHRDQYRDWRLDVDDMSYEELLELGDRIGYVSTGLREDEILHCLRRSKYLMMDNFPPSSLPTESDWKCSICQEDYTANDDVGKLNCGHGFHLCCIKQWLLRKNACPVCKSVAAVQH